MYPECMYLFIALLDLFVVVVFNHPENPENLASYTGEGSKFLCGTTPMPYHCQVH